MLVYCGQTVGWIKMQLGTEVGLGSGHIVLDGDPTPLPKGAKPPPILVPRLLWSNGWMDQDATWYGGRPRPRRLQFWANFDGGEIWHGGSPLLHAKFHPHDGPIGATTRV